MRPEAPDLNLPASETRVKSEEDTAPRSPIRIIVEDAVEAVMGRWELRIIDLLNKYGFEELRLAQTASEGRIMAAERRIDGHDDQFERLEKRMSALERAERDRKV